MFAVFVFLYTSERFFNSIVHIHNKSLVRCNFLTISAFWFCLYARIKKPFLLIFSLFFVVYFILRKKPRILRFWAIRLFSVHLYTIDRIGHCQHIGYDAHQLRLDSLRQFQFAAILVQGHPRFARVSAVFPLKCRE